MKIIKCIYSSIINKMVHVCTSLMVHFHNAVGDNNEISKASHSVLIGLNGIPWQWNGYA
jgi:hypothetical protein